MRVSTIPGATALTVMPAQRSSTAMARVSPTTAAHVQAEFPTLAVLDGGACAVGIESTIVDVSGEVPAILRPGRITALQIEKVLGMSLEAPSGESPAAPGTLPAHYAPRAKARLAKRVQIIEELVVNRGRKIAVLALEISVPRLSPALTVVESVVPASYARALYENLRRLDATGADLILVEGAGSPGEINLRHVFDDFVRVHEGARELVQGGQWLGELKGAPLRCSLRGARVAAPGILVTGEAAGSTYSFTGEGIGKALETGLLAAQALLEARDQGLDEASLAQRYQSMLAVLQPKFDLYERGNRVNYHPWLTDILVRRAAKSPRLRQRMAHLLEERSTPAQLITVRGLIKLFLD